MFVTIKILLKEKLEPIILKIESMRIKITTNLREKIEKLSVENEINKKEISIWNKRIESILRKNEENERLLQIKKDQIKEIEDEIRSSKEFFPDQLVEFTQNALRFTAAHAMVVRCYAGIDGVLLMLLISTFLIKV